VVDVVSIVVGIPRWLGSDLRWLVGDKGLNFQDST
jgi:hypothetical protein